MSEMSETSEMSEIFNIQHTLSFSKLFQIENLLNIKEVMSENINICQRCIIQSKVNLIHCIHIGDVGDESNYIAFDLILRYFTSPTSPTCIDLILCDYID